MITLPDSVITDVELKQIAWCSFLASECFFRQALHLRNARCRMFLARKSGIQLILHKTFASGNPVKAQCAIHPHGPENQTNCDSG